jgi:hypothetical protein
MWVNTSTDLTYTAWAPGQPDGRYVRVCASAWEEAFLPPVPLLLLLLLLLLRVCTCAISNVQSLPDTHHITPHTCAHNRYGGEDCLAVSITLGAATGAGLREVVSTQSKWYDHSCSSNLPFVCQSEWGGPCAFASPPNS